MNVVNTFIGRDWTKSIDDNWPGVREVWPGIIAEAKAAGVKIGIENCPMLFSKDEWPGGKNLAVSPAIWKRLFAEFPDGTLGLNFDPSHLIFQHIDYVRAIRDFGKHFVHVHAKDTRIDATNSTKSATRARLAHAEDPRPRRCELEPVLQCAE